MSAAVTAVTGMTDAEVRALNDRLEAEGAILRVEEAADRLATACRAEMELEDERPAQKSAAVRRLMGTENPETNKPHSASSAEKIVETDGEYAAHRRKQYDAVVEKQRAYGAYEAAKLRARLSVDLATAEAR
jgi:ABC-type hemin transport system substrate-binding protein